MVTIGSRKSQLAMWQTEYVQNLLKQLYPEKEFNIIGISTTGDKILDTALSKIGSKSLFTKELEIALENNSVDIVVHSLKDLPTSLPPGMTICAILEREDPRDAVVMSKNHSYSTLGTLPKGSIIGTSSVRRIAQLKVKYPNLEFQDIRGNLNTRISKLDAKDSPYAALLLAYAGLSRLGWNDRISEILSPDVMLHAVGQGALAVECRDSDIDMISLLKPLNHESSVIRCTAERAFMRALEGGCSVPLGVFSSFENNLLEIRGNVSSLDGSESVEDSCLLQIDNVGLEKNRFIAEKLGHELAEKLIKKGAKDILGKIRNT